MSKNNADVSSFVLPKVDESALRAVGAVPGSGKESPAVVPRVWGIQG